MALGFLSVEFVLLGSFAFIQMNVTLAFYFPNIGSSNSHYYINLSPKTLLQAQTASFLCHADRIPCVFPETI